MKQKENAVPSGNNTAATTPPLGKKNRPNQGSGGSGGGVGESGDKITRPSFKLTAKLLSAMVLTAHRGLGDKKAADPFAVRNYDGKAALMMLPRNWIKPMTEKLRHVRESGERKKGRQSRRK